MAEGATGRADGEGAGPRQGDPGDGAPPRDAGKRSDAAIRLVIALIVLIALAWPTLWSPALAFGLSGEAGTVRVDDCRWADPLSEALSAPVGMDAGCRGTFTYALAGPGERPRSDVDLGYFYQEGDVFPAFIAADGTIRATTTIGLLGSLFPTSFVLYAVPLLLRWASRIISPRLWSATSGWFLLAGAVLATVGVAVTAWAMFAR